MIWNRYGIRLFVALHRGCCLRAEFFFWGGGFEVVIFGGGSGDGGGDVDAGLGKGIAVL